MSKTQNKNNHAFIDGANLHHAMNMIELNLDYRKFKKWLQDKYKIKKAYENNFDQAILISSDGDYTPLINYLLLKNKIKAILSPADHKRCSILIKRTGVKIVYLSEQKNILSRNEKAPNRD